MGLPHMEHLGLFQIAASLTMGPAPSGRPNLTAAKKKAAPETHRKYHGVPWNA